ncbi:MAG: hypothetical protein ABIV43_01840 [Candidatus Saccharimonadales bacterium]
MKQLIKHLRTVSLILCIVTGFGWTASAQAAEKSSVTTAKPTTVDISHAVINTYNADASVQLGMIVQIKDKQPTDVVPLTAATAEKMLGIVIPNNTVTIVLTPSTVTKQQVLVATTGRYSVLVSNQNGPVKSGDYLTISAISGVAMKAGITDQQVIGQATADFSGSANVISSVTLKNQIGKDTKVAIGRVGVAINIAHNPLDQKTVDFVPAFMVGLAQAVANKSVSVARIYLSTVVLIISSVVTGIMLYSGIRSGMIAVGRNPLSKKSIIKSLIQTILAGMCVFIVGIVAVYLLLKL